jgi:exonuclease SbcD
VSNFLFATDAHVRGSSPEGRIDDFPEAVLDKLRQIGELARTEGSEAVVFGGDMFHEPDPATSVVTSVIRILKGYPCPIYTVWGSHDVFGYSEQTLKRSALGVLIEAHVLRMLDARKATQVGPFDLVGLSHSYTLDRTEGAYDLSRLELQGTRGKGILVEVVHGMLLAKPFKVALDYTLIGNVHTDAQVVLSGHYHPGFGTVRLGKTVFCNPGSLGRLENTAANRTRRVCVAEVMDVEGDVNVVHVELSTRLGTEVFDDRIVEVDDKRELDLFVKQLHQQMGAVDMQDAKKLILTVAKERKASNELCNHLVGIVEAAQQEA